MRKQDHDPQQIFQYFETVFEPTTKAQVLHVNHQYCVGPLNRSTLAPLRALWNDGHFQASLLLPVIAVLLACTALMMPAHLVLTLGGFTLVGRLLTIGYRYGKRQTDREKEELLLL